MVLAPAIASLSRLSAAMPAGIALARSASFVAFRSMCDRL